MTTIIGYTNGVDLYIAGDKSASDGQTMVVTDTPKVYRIGSSVAIGFAGSWRGGELGVQALRGLDVDSPDCNIHDMTAAIAESWREADFKNEDTTFLIGYSGQWFEIQPDLGHIAIFGDFHAIGSGAQFALGSLYSSEEYGPSRLRIKVAFEAAAKWTECTADHTFVMVEA